MSIRTPSKRRGAPPRMVRTTISLPEDLLEAVEQEVRDGKAASRNELVREALAMELWRREQQAIDAAYAEGFADPELIAESERIMKEFESADSETARMIDEEYGPWDGPVD